MAKQPIILMLASAVALTATALLGAIACGSGEGAPLDSTAPISSAQVDIKASKFTPRVIEVRPGADVTWNFKDGHTPHNVGGEGWSSETKTSGSYSKRIDKPGTYDYRCTLHNGMTGRVVVRTD